MLSPEGELAKGHWSQRGEHALELEGDGNLVGVSRIRAMGLQTRSLLVASAACCVGLALFSLLASRHTREQGLLSLTAGPPVIYLPASVSNDFSIQIPSAWKPGTKLGVKVRSCCLGSGPQRLPQNLSRASPRNPLWLPE